MNPTQQELMDAVIAEVELRAWQERAVKDIGRTTKIERAAHEHAAFALDNLARDLKRGVVLTRLKREGLYAEQ